MKILHILAQLPSKTGSGVYFTNVIKGFHNQQNACIYGCYPGFPTPDLPVSQQYPVTFPNSRCDFPLPGMSDVMPYQSTRYGDMTPQMITNWQTAFTLKIKEALTDFHPDVIFCHHLWFLTSMVCQLTSVPVYAFCHGTDIRQAKQHPDLLKYTQYLSRVQHVFALSNIERNNISKTYDIPKSKITVIGGGYDPSIFYPPEKKTAQSTINVVYAGKISGAKGVFDLAKVFTTITKDFPNAHLHLIGNASQPAQERLAPYLSNSNIKLYNVADQMQLANLYCRSDIFVLPSYFEGLGLVAIEALACNLRVVTTTIPALQEQLGPVVNDSGIISYVDLPRLVNQDVPVEADLPAFHHRLKAALEQQILAIQKGVAFPSDVHNEVSKNSWPHLIARIRQVLSQEK